MNYLHSLILGIVEGLTEFLPISSTGHLIISSKLLGLADTEFLKSFEIIIQLGAILAVVVLYARRILSNLKLFWRLVVAFIPTGILGLLFYKIVKSYLLGSIQVVLWSFLVGGAVLIVFELLHREEGPIGDVGEITYKQSFLIGFFQAIAIIPGVSRAAATIVGGLALGINRKTIVEFSFMLAIPTMIAATGFDLLKNASSFNSQDFGFLGVGFATSFLAAILAVRLFLRFIQSHTFISFGIYRILLAILLFSLHF